jgi:hypothetical protein
MLSIICLSVQAMQSVRASVVLNKARAVVVLNNELHNEQALALLAGARHCSSLPPDCCVLGELAFGVVELVAVLLHKTTDVLKASHVNIGHQR